MVREGEFTKILGKRRKWKSRMNEQQLIKYYHEHQLIEYYYEPFIRLTKAINEAKKEFPSTNYDLNEDTQGSLALKIDFIKEWFVKWFGEK